MNFSFRSYGKALEGYIRSGNVLRENSARYLNLEDP